MLRRTVSMYPNTSEMTEFRHAVYKNTIDGWGSAIPFNDGNGSYNSDDQNRLSEFNAHWYSYNHKYYQNWELTFRSIMDFKGDNIYADYSSMGSFEDLSRFFWSGMFMEKKEEFLKNVYFGNYYKDIEALETEWEISNNYRERSPVEE